ncbi:MAG: hypothetical protein JXR97_07625, partial [Planctomycetes bacterium]|nr:hypothetical protein [Planctomycetota bacterium]
MTGKKKTAKKAATRTRKTAAEAAGVPAEPTGKPTPSEQQITIPPPPEEDQPMSASEAEANQEEYVASLSSDQLEERGKIQDKVYEQIKQGELHITALKSMTVAELRK